MTTGSAHTHLEALANRFPTHAALMGELAELTSNKLWHQLTLKIKEIFKTSVISDVALLTAFHNEFLAGVANHLQPLAYAGMVIHVSRQLQDNTSAIGFLHGVLESLTPKEEESSRVSSKAPIDPQALLLLRAALAGAKIRAKDVKDADDMLHEVQKEINDRTFTDSHVFSQFYKSLAELHKAKGKPSLFYKAALQFLAYTNVDEEMSGTAQQAWAYDMGLAAFLGDEVYTFGELLRQPLLQVLNGTEGAWMPELLQAFNDGNLKRYEEMASVIQQQPALASNKSLLDEKVRLMALVEMLFRRAPNDRVLSFTAIEQACHVERNQVEWLVLKALGLELIRGTLDQVDEVVEVTWVMPRVLDNAQIKNLRDKIAQWNEKVQSTMKEVQTETGKELLA